MSHEAAEQAIDILGIKLDSKDMRVLRAVLTTQMEPTEFVGFDEIRNSLAAIEEGRRGEDPLIYRSLSNLQNIGFLETEQRGKANGYRSNAGLIERGVDRLTRTRIADLQTYLLELESEVDRVDSIDSGKLSEQLVKYSLGSINKPELEETLFVQGWDALLDLIDRKIYSNLSDNDTIRITLEWVNQPQNVESERLQAIERFMTQGAYFKVLDHRRQDESRLRRYRQLTKRMTEHGKRPGFAITRRSDATYQFIARNREGIILVVSENPLSATWIPRTANPELVDDAISSFDADFEAGVDIFEYEEEER